MDLNPPLYLFNTLSREKEKFKPLMPGQVGMYICGPTVYDYAHIGNWRSFLTSDLLRRTLEYNGYKVKQVMNITDVDDKTIAGSQKVNRPLPEFTKFYEEAFVKDLASLNIVPSTHLIRATEHLSEIIALITKLLEQEQAYKTSDGIYFSVAAFADYGKLSKRPIEVTDRQDDASHDKRDPRDFALWKFQTPEDGEIGWEAPFGKGRPGWHIECSAMSLKELGEQFDIHTGGSDLIFPHHENEIAQSEAATGKAPLVRYWLHTAFLNIDQEKMSKSLSNFYTLRDLEERQFAPLAYRLWLLTAHYRSPASFSWQAMDGAQNAYQNLTKTYLDLGTESGQVNANYKSQFLAGINNDLNTPMALALVWKLLKDPTLSLADKRATLLDFDKVLGLNLIAVKPIAQAKIPKEIIELADRREKARQDKDWTEADRLRQQIEEQGYAVEDGASGPIVTNHI
ncbi:MAG: cysteine--tRNA ligase [Patescibacteria group bacterium]|nr:cysteine--tRNA ligase [Patescibacteria group bacterium]